MQTRVTTSPALTLAGRNGTFAIGPSPGIKELWERFMQDFGKIAGQVGTKAYGVCHRFDGTLESGGHMDYMAAVQVVNAGDVPGYLHTLIIPARREIVFRHDGDVDTLSETWRLIFAEHLPAAKLTVADGPQYEVYDFSPDETTSNITIHIPIV